MLASQAMGWGYRGPGKKFPAMIINTAVESTLYFVVTHMTKKPALNLYKIQTNPLNLRSAMHNHWLAFSKNCRTSSSHSTLMPQNNMLEIINAFALILSTEDSSCSNIYFSFKLEEPWNIEEWNKSFFLTFKGFRILILPLFLVLGSAGGRFIQKKYQ